MALIGEMQYLTIGGSTYSIPTGTTVEVERNLTSGTKSATIKVDGTSYDLYAPTPNAGTVTSVRVQATSPVQSSTSTAQSSSLNTTISLANGYGDTKNPYGTKTKNYVLAGPTTGSDAAPTFRALVAADIPDLSSTYLTSYTETDPVYSASAASGITSSDISNWNSKTSNTGTITSVKTTAGAHTTINVSSGAANFNVPTATSHLTNDSGFITSFTDVNVTNTAVTAATTYYLTGSTSSSTATGGLSKHAAIKAYVTANTSTGGSARIDLGNTTATTSAGGKEGIIRLYGTSATYYVELKAGAPSANRTINFPNKAGTVALTDDIPTVSYPVTSVNNKTGAVSLSASDVGALASSTTYVSTVTTTAGTHSIISSKSGAVSFNVPTKTSHLTNDSGFLTSYTETDPVFGASAAAGITSTDINNWNAKVSDDKTWNGVSLARQEISIAGDIYVPSSSVSTGNASISFSKCTATPTASKIAKYDSSAYLNSTTPSANDNSTKVATTAYVDAAIPTVPTKTSDLTNDSGFITSSAVPVLLSGSTSTITPTQVINALANNQNIEISYTDATYGTSKVYDFIYNTTMNLITAPLIFRWNGEWLLFELVGQGSDDTWYVLDATLAQLSDIPTNTSELTNDSGYAVINNITVTLTTAGWSNNSQSITVTGVTTSNNVIVTAAAASESTYLNCGVKCSSQATDTLTFTCTTTPTAAIDVNVIVLTGN